MSPSLSHFIHPSFSCTRNTQHTHKCCFNTLFLVRSLCITFFFFVLLLSLATVGMYRCCFSWQKQREEFGAHKYHSLHIFYALIYICVGYVFMHAYTVFLFNLLAKATRAYSTHHLALGALIYFGSAYLNIFNKVFFLCWYFLLVGQLDGWLVVCFIRAYDLPIYCVCCIMRCKQLSPPLLMLPSFIYFSISKSFCLIEYIWLVHGAIKPEPE